MKYIAQIKIMPLKELLDPQGKAVSKTLANIGYTNISDVRIGKQIQLQLDAENSDAAKLIITSACEKLLCNRVMESYSFEIKEA